MTVYDLRMALSELDEDKDIQIYGDGLGGGYINIVKKESPMTYKVVKRIEVKKP